MKALLKNYQLWTANHVFYCDGRVILNKNGIRIFSLVCILLTINFLISLLLLTIVCSIYLIFSHIIMQVRVLLLE